LFLSNKEKEKKEEDFEEDFVSMQK